MLRLCFVYCGAKEAKETGNHLTRLDPHIRSLVYVGW